MDRCTRPYSALQYQQVSWYDSCRTSCCTMAEKSYYAVKKGRDGPKIYDSWEECGMAVAGYSRVEVKKFKSLVAAEAWILPALMSLCPPAEQLTQSTQPISAGPGPSNAATSCGEDILAVDTRGGEATRPPVIVLSAEQADILVKVKRGGNVFFTGPAGNREDGFAS
ncbi:hypothetical protein BJY52DRAFT_143921 [Lactarius psammicola]|nr:hypothetical protein BJY52DRAFT_143921 [Lactarius psammicola]